MISRRKHDGTSHGFVDPQVQLNAGLWTLFAGATVFLGLRLYIKITRRHGLWWDDHILLVSWLILLANNTMISIQYATGYVTDGSWDDRMHILINITSCGTLLGQALSKSAFAATLLKLTKTKKLYQGILWFIIVSMNSYMIVKVIFQWAKVCEEKSYNVWYRLDFCLHKSFRTPFKEGGNAYNIIMDFVLAAFPWIITWNLDMRRVEKIGLCITMSLGMVVAIISAIRTSWKFDGNERDEWYFWRNAHSNIWYSSEIVGTIIVQCIPVMRPFLRDIKVSLTSKRLQENSQATNKRRTMTIGFGPGPTIGSKPTHNYQIYSDAKDTYNDTKESEPYVDSWDTQGIYQKKEFEMTTMDVKPQQENSIV